MMEARFNSSRRALRYRSALMLAVAVLLIATQPARAVLLPPGGSILSVGEPEPSPVSTVVATTTLPFVALTFSGTLTSTVLAGDVTNPLGGLTFTYLLTNNAASPNGEERLTVNGYGGFATDVSYQSPAVNPAVGVAPSLFDRSPGAGNTIGFQFVGPPLGLGVVSPGSNSLLLIVQTAAQHIQNTTANVIDGSSVSVGTYAPAIVPEPSTLVLAGLACGIGLVARIRSRHRRRD